MLMWILIASLAQAKGGPTPLDAFRANHAAVKAEMDFVITPGKIDSSVIRDGTIWSAKVIPLTEEQKDRTIEGTWACDGATEYYYCGSPDALIAENRARLAKSGRPSGGEIQLGYKPKVEGVFDGDVMAEHTIDEPLDPYHGDISVRKNGNDVLYTQGKGPYSWWECTFPYYLSYRFPNTAPRVVQLNRGPYPLDVEVYTKEIGKARLRLEVGYDPAVGYVPRHTRLISRGAEGKTFVRETYAVKIEPCKAGGFVPTEWYIAHFNFDDFDSRYPDYDEAVNLEPPKNSVYVEHFLATRFQDRTNAVALVRLAGVNALVSTGGTVKLQKGVGVLTMANIKAKLGRNLTRVVSSNPLPSIDASELHEFDRSSGPFWPWGVAIAVILLLGGVTLRRLIRKRRTVQALICLAPLIALGGCSGQTSPAVSLSGRVDPSSPYPQSTPGCRS